jgi:hypothetical protein
MGEGGVHSSDELMIEFELCIGLIFKPLRHHLPNLLAASSSSSSAGVVTGGGGGGDKNGILSVWKSILSALEELLGDADKMLSLDLSSSDRQEASGSAGGDGAPPHPVVAIPKALRGTMNSLAVEHLRNAITVLMSSGLVFPDDGDESAGAVGSTAADASAITSVTVEACRRMRIGEGTLKEWKKHAAAAAPTS